MAGITLEVPDGGGAVAVLRIRFDRPPVNVLSAADLEALARAIEVARVREPRVLVLTGLPRAFSAGVDVAEHAPEPAAIDRMLSAMRAVAAALVDTPAVTIAQVSGACLGGGAEIAAACDLVLAAQDARIGFPEIRLACFPPAGSAFLPLRIGTARAADWILTGRSVSGREAGEAGFASRVCRGDALEEETRRVASEIASRSPAALRAALASLRAPRREALSAGGALDSAERAYRALAGDPDLARAVSEWHSEAGGRL